MLLVLLLAWLLPLLFFVQAMPATFTTKYYPTPPPRPVAPTPALLPPPASSMGRLRPRDRDWREPSTTSTAPYCMPITISSGLLVYSHGLSSILIAPPLTSSNTLSLPTSSVARATAVTFTPLCPDGQMIIVNGKSNFDLTDVIEHELGYSPSQIGLPFYNSVIPTCIVLAAAVAIVYVTLLVMLSQFDKRPFFQLLTVCVTTATITTTFIQVTRFLEDQAKNGYYDGNELSDFLSSDTVINVMFPINTLFLTMAQVQVLFHIFERKREKIVVFWFGLVLSVTQASLGAVSVAIDILYPTATLTESQDAVKVFAYLFKVATAIMYAACIIFFSIIKRKIAYRPEVFLLASLSIMSSLSPIVLFILDLLEPFIDSWADFADLLALMASSVVVWEWIDRVHTMERTIQQNSVLGRQYYEEDQAYRVAPTTIKPKPENPSLPISYTDRGDSPLTDAPTLVVTPSNDPTRTPSPPRRRSNLSAFLAWVRNPIERPETASSTQTTYIPIFRRSPATASSKPESPDVPSQDQGQEELPQFVHPFKKRPSTASGA